MTHQDGTSLYKADDGKMIVRKSDGFIMGDSIDLGISDSIDNYEEREFTEEERAAFWESIGMEDPKKRKVAVVSPTPKAEDNAAKNKEGI